ncbi:putative holin-like toxin [Paenibacillus andongensis]|nr:putative holin-like toxin [Paenibacillus andongensis]
METFQTIVIMLAFGSFKLALGDGIGRTVSLLL